MAPEDLRRSPAAPDGDEEGLGALAAIVYEM